MIGGGVMASGDVASAPGVVETVDGGHIRRRGDVEASIVDIEITIIHIA
jgi:hypothetical protein